MAVDQAGDATTGLRFLDEIAQEFSGSRFAFGDTDGLLYGGGTELLIDQTVAAVAVMAYSFVITYMIAKVIDATMGLRVEETAERTGLDQSQHAESAYQA